MILQDDLIRLSHDIWKARCNFLFNQQALNSTQVLLAISNYCAVFNEANRAPPPLMNVSRTVPSVAHRSPPFSPYLKVNVDASWQLSTRNGYVGVVIRDVEGQFVAAARYAIQAPNVVSAEAMAILRGCQLVVALGHQWVIVESGSKESISSLSSSLDNGRWEVFPTLANVLRLQESFQGCHWSWVPRSANLATDRLASRINTDMCNVIWVNRPPSSLVFVSINDGLPCPP